MLGVVALSQWANIAAIVGAMMDVINTGRDTFEFFYNKREKAS